MQRTCLRDPIPEIFQASKMLDRAVTAHFEGHTSEVEALLNASNMPAIREWTESLWGKNSPYVVVSRKNASPVTQTVDRLPPASRMPLAAIRSRLLRRDGFHCRFCGIPIIRAEVRRLFAKRYPLLPIWGKTNSSQHAAFQAMWVQYDHIHAHSGGGQTDLANLVITCAPCNFGRMEHSCESVGLQDPRERTPVPSTWDGLERFLPAGQRMPKKMASEGLTERMTGEPIIGAS